MDDKAVVGFVTFVLTGLATFFTTRWQMRKSHEGEYGRMVREARLRTYPMLWGTLEPLALYARYWMVTNQTLWRLSGSLRRWYFEQGGMYLTDHSRDAYFALQRSLGNYLTQKPWRPDQEAQEVDEDAFETIRERGSDLRTQLVRDLGTRRQDAPAELGSGSHGTGGTMTDTTADRSTEVYGRTPDQDLELWKHHASFGGEDKNRMVTVASLLLGFSAAILGYSARALQDGAPCALAEPIGQLRVLTLAVGILVSLLAAYVIVLYGGYANWNWDMADQIATRRKWEDLKPSKRELPGRGLHVTAWRWARPCRPREELPRVFLIFMLLAGFSVLAHVVVFGWHVMEQCPALL